ncbi:MAG TPA: acyl-CoA dehydrogenase family protein [Gaiellaceae bacterium]|nr:acyl-CoA dehydrogenase family protein [Gaiellaceae bacterium]
MDAVETAQRLADELLYPAALETDAAETLPAALLDALAAAGMYGLAGPESAGGINADFPTVARVWEALSSGCLTTAFVWGQHIGATLAAASSENDAVRARLPELCSGAQRAGLALGGALPGPPRLEARETADGWLFDGFSPFVSGWGRIDVVHTAARTGDGRLVWAFVDAATCETLEVERLRLVALDATATVRATFHAHPVPAECVTSASPYGERPTPPEVLRLHAAFALGVASRCCRLLGRSPLDDELADCRTELDRLDPETIEAARAAAGELALRASAALLAARGSGSLLLDDHAQRLAREALFVLVYALRPGSREALLGRLDAA